MTDTNIPHAKLVDACFPAGFLSSLKDGVSFPAAANDLLGDQKWRSATDACVKPFMEMMREAGLVTACPNNGPRGVMAMTAWNQWIEGKEPEFFNALHRAPAFEMGGRRVVRHILRGDDDTLDEAAADALLADTEQKVRAFYLEGKLNLQDKVDALSGCLVDQITGDYYSPGDDIYAPVLCAHDPKTGKDEPLPLAEEPASVRHVEMQIPSGKLVMCDWLRVDGFNEGLAALAGDESHWPSINTAEGLDIRAEAYLKMAGLMIVQVGNTSPRAYADGEGVYRMGWVHEDYEELWRGDDEYIGPHPVWSTCTDLWANIFADREIFIDILMASGMYETRRDAAGHVDFHCVYGNAELVEMEPGPLHVYMPTGYAVHAETFNDKFRAAELENPEWRQDYYVISRKPLTVDPELLAKDEWLVKVPVAPEPTATPSLL